MKTTTWATIAGSFALLGLATSANAIVVTEKYSASNSNGYVAISGRDELEFDFDLWYTNGTRSGVSGTSGFSLTNDGKDAVGAWSAARLYIEFFSTDSGSSGREVLDGGLRAWASSASGGTTVVNLNNTDVSGSSGFYTRYFDITGSSLNTFDNYGWGTLKLGVDDDRSWTIGVAKVWLQVTAAGPTNPPVAISEPGTLGLLGFALAGLGFVTRRRRAK